MPSAVELYGQTEQVIGQQKARKQLAVLLERQQLVAKGVLPKASGAILAGWTGSGKTYLASSMCRLADLPYAEVNATQYTEVGYIGMSLTQMFLPLLADAATKIDEENGVESTTSVLQRDDIQTVLERASVGVVLLDEFDKWMLQSPDASGRNPGRKLQSELLKLVEGTSEYVSDDEDELGVFFNTTKVLIICAGAFVGLERMVRRRLELTEYNEALWDQIEPADFFNYGLMAELAGRLSTHIFVRPLKEEHLTTILMKEDGILAEYQARFHALGVEWNVPEESVRYIARIAIHRNTGARGVEHVMWQMFSEALFDASMGRGRRVSLYPNNHQAVIE